MAATAYGAVAVPSGHQHESGAGDVELVAQAAHDEGQEAEHAPGQDERLAALGLSILAVGVVLAGIRTTIHIPGGGAPRTGARRTSVGSAI
jgi:hypothetical protein